MFNHMTGKDGIKLFVNRRQIGRGDHPSNLRYIRGDEPKVRCYLLQLCGRMNVCVADVWADQEWPSEGSNL